VIDGDHGFTDGPNSEGSVVEWLPHSGVLVLPNITSPAARYRSTIHAESVATCVRNAREPIASSRSGQRRPKILEQERNSRKRTRSCVMQHAGSVERRCLLPAAVEEVGVQLAGGLEARWSSV